MIFRIKDKFGNIIRLTNERWQHIIDRHPEIKPNIRNIEKTIKNPEIIVCNPYNIYEKYCHKYFRKIKNYIIVVVEQKKSFIITAYIGRKIKKGKIKWKKN